MNQRLPNEMIFRISKLAGEESTFDLKPFVLVSRQWHAIEAPTLLTAISVSSLGKLVDLCDQIIAYQHNGESSPSSIAKYTRTIIISGKINEGTADSHLGLEGLGKQPRGVVEGLEEDSIRADIEMEPDAIRDKVRAAVSQIVLLDGFEWYGRFAGDYHLARYLQESKAIRHLAYGIDMFVSSTSLAYREHAFMFEGLETLVVTTEYEPNSDLFRAIARMMRRNSDLRSIVRLYLRYFLAEKSAFIWPNLSHLVLRYWKGDLWRSAKEVELLAKFLVTHPKIETLVLQETCLEDLGGQTANQLSLIEYPESLPVLKRVLGSPRLIAGVLESRAACLSVERVIDNSEESFDSEGVKAPYIDRIIDALAAATNNRIQRLRLEVPQLDRNLYMRIARLVPKVRFLEFLRSFDLDSTAPNDGDFNPLLDIPSALNEFPNLEVIGGHIAKDFAKGVAGHEYDDLLELARRVPKIRAIHELQGKIIPINRHPSGKVSISGPPRFLNNEDYDWMTFDVDWRHRPMSRRELKRLRGLDNSEELEYKFM